MSRSMNFPIQNNFNSSNENSNSYAIGKPTRMDQDNIYAQYKPALSRENSMSREYPPTNLSLVVEPKKMEYDVMMK